jgi:hypothetical protein
MVEFDPMLKRVIKQLMWIKLPNLALELWSIEAINAIMNYLSHYIEVDGSFLHTTS